MATTKIYPATQTQAQTIINKIDAMDEKIVTPNYQDKTVTPSDTQQTVQADNGYTALHSVTVEPIAAAMPENLEAFIMNSSVEPFSISIDGAVPEYACYKKTYLKRVYGNLTSIGGQAFYNCTGLESVDLRNATSIGIQAFYNCTGLESVDLRNATSIGNEAFYNCTGLESVDLSSMVDWHNFNSYCFEKCTNLKKVILKSLITFGINSHFKFRNCSTLKFVDMRTIREFTCLGCFDSCQSLELIDFTLVSSVPSLSDANTFSNTNNTWVAVVPNDSLKAAMQSATNWSTYASHIKTIAEVEAEVGMSYDDYYLQCFGHPRF